MAATVPTPLLYNVTCRPIYSPVVPLCWHGLGTSCMQRNYRWLSNSTELYRWLSIKQHLWNVTNLLCTTVTYTVISWALVHTESQIKGYLCYSQQWVLLLQRWRWFMPDHRNLLKTQSLKGVSLLPSCALRFCVSRSQCIRTLSISTIFLFV